MAVDIITSIVTGGTNNHSTVSEEANAVATDFATVGVVGSITNTSGVSPATGSFAVNQSSTPAMTVDITLGKAYVSGTPSGQSTQTLRARMESNYTGYVINSNSSGSTKYDWIYLKLDATTAANPASTANDVITLYTSRSTSNTSDTGTPPTFGILLAVVTVANGASSIVNANIVDKRSNSVLGVSTSSSFTTDAIVGKTDVDSGTVYGIPVTDGRLSRVYATGTTSASITTTGAGVLKANFIKVYYSNSGTPAGGTAQIDALSGKTKNYDRTTTGGNLGTATYATTLVAECSWNISTAETLSVTTSGSNGAGLISASLLLEFTKF